MNQIGLLKKLNNNDHSNWILITRKNRLIKWVLLGKSNGKWFS